MRRIGILTSGGDAPGMNAAIRAAVRHALGKGLEVIGIRRGYAGLLAGEMRALTRAEVANIIQRGGTVLGTSRCEEFLDAKGRARAAAVLQGAGIEGLIVVGGEGTFHGATLLAAEQGVCVAGVPGTIDNDVYGTDFTIGFDTAINTALEAIDRIRDTAASHERLFLVEVMGRTSGDIALGVGVAGGAEDVLIPEIPTDLIALGHELRFLFITSAARVHQVDRLPEGTVHSTHGPLHGAEPPRVSFTVKRTEAVKCVRCWQRRPDVGSDPNHPQICSRCVTNVDGPGETRQYA